jgi:hypothetical protein
MVEYMLKQYFQIWCRNGILRNIKFSRSRRVANLSGDSFIGGGAGKVTLPQDLIGLEISTAGRTCMGYDGKTCFYEKSGSIA